MLPCPLSLFCPVCSNTPCLAVCLQVPEMLLSLANLKANGTNLFFKQFASLATAGQEVMAAITSGMNPIELVAKSLLNVNITELINVAPQVRPAVAPHGVTGGSAFCLHSWCCKWPAHWLW